MATTSQPTFTRYEKFVVAILALLQFTIVLDFMVLSPLGAILMQELQITTSQFGLVVSAYAFSAGASGLLAAGFADKFDRKKLLLFFYAGFVLGTFFCGLAPDYPSLMAARIFTGIFGGVISSISFAIITDLFPVQVRGRVMGFVQMAFASSQVLGIPIGLYLANELGWHAPFLMIVGLSLLIGLAIVFYLRPIDMHLALQTRQNAFQHLFKTVSQARYLRAFMATTLLATGGFMLMPFGSAFSVHNLGIDLHQLPLLYMCTGLITMITSPIIGKLSDKLGKIQTFVIGSAISGVMVLIYCNLGLTPLWLVIAINAVLFVGITSRMIASSALITAVPAPQDRGAFMGVNSSVQQVSGGVAAAVAGLIVSETTTGKLVHYDTVGYLVVVTIVITVVLMYRIHRDVFGKKKSELTTAPST
ncbi:MFS transporter [Rhabdobacter roseus]|uniref:Putative MFS family arabinose efflux permease n=1 Tax=Rhabdobacter roseus TaxID=1655419 RepID=A0A840TL50_9BACT|nr:MFS transporter [Rhabdobacter roseus]MBB5283665.1 putative MFS family arabinose efflux permease [Rhabdobacter roseus]